MYIAIASYPISYQQFGRLKTDTYSHILCTS
uniref:Uncharacterized protein n=1 Tax=Caudovirales sp. ctTqA28 TaxID=2826775 RepID=A0A8S5MD89_9CAUD|nr:MAG TPA: hypothetical protein [Caudovirales sp. ctTqA28]